MSSWIVPSNPTTTYRLKDFLEESHDIIVDWIARGQFKTSSSIGDTVYIYESKNGGRGGIIYKMKIIKTNVPFEAKIEDEGFWIGGYPEYVGNPSAQFNRLERISTPEKGIISLEELKEYDFSPNNMLHPRLLPNAGGLSLHIESHFK